MAGRLGGSSTVTTSAEAREALRREAARERLQLSQKGLMAFGQAVAASGGGQLRAHRGSAVSNGPLGANGLTNQQILFAAPFKLSEDDEAARMVKTVLGDYGDYRSLKNISIGGVTSGTVTGPETGQSLFHPSAGPGGALQTVAQHNQSSHGNHHHSHHQSYSNQQQQQQQASTVPATLQQHLPLQTQSRRSQQPGPPHISDSRPAVRQSNGVASSPSVATSSQASAGAPKSGGSGHQRAVLPTPSCPLPGNHKLLTPAARKSHQPEQSGSSRASVSGYGSSLSSEHASKRATSAHSSSHHSKGSTLAHSHPSTSRHSNRHASSIENATTVNYSPAAQNKSFAAQLDEIFKEMRSPPAPLDEIDADECKFDRDSTLEKNRISDRATKEDPIVNSLAQSNQHDRDKSHTHSGGGSSGAAVVAPKLNSVSSPQLSDLAASGNIGPLFDGRRGVVPIEAPPTALSPVRSPAHTHNGLASQQALSTAVSGGRTTHEIDPLCPVVSTTHKSAPVNKPIPTTGSALKGSSSASFLAPTSSRVETCATSLDTASQPIPALSSPGSSSSDSDDEDDDDDDDRESASLEDSQDSDAEQNKSMRMTSFDTKFSGTSSSPQPEKISAPFGEAVAKAGLGGNSEGEKTFAGNSPAEMATGRSDRRASTKVSNANASEDVASCATSGKLPQTASGSPKPAPGDAAFEDGKASWSLAAFIPGVASSSVSLGQKPSPKPELRGSPTSTADTASLDPKGSKSKTLESRSSKLSEGKGFSAGKQEKEKERRVDTRPTKLNSVDDCPLSEKSGTEKGDRISSNRHHQQIHKTQSTTNESLNVTRDAGRSVQRLSSKSGNKDCDGVPLPVDVASCANKNGEKRCNTGSSPLCSERPISSAGRSPSDDKRLSASRRQLSPRHLTSQHAGDNNGNLCNDEKRKVRQSHHQQQRDSSVSEQLGSRKQLTPELTAVSDETDINGNSRKRKLLAADTVRPNNGSATKPRSHKPCQQYHGDVNDEDEKPFVVRVPIKRLARVPILKSKAAFCEDSCDKSIKKDGRPIVRDKKLDPKSLTRKDGDKGVCSLGANEVSHSRLSDNVEDCLRSVSPLSIDSLSSCSSNNTSIRLNRKKIDPSVIDEATGDRNKKRKIEESHSKEAKKKDSKQKSGIFESASKAEPDRPSKKSREVSDVQVEREKSDKKDVKKEDRRRNHEKSKGGSDGNAKFKTTKEKQRDKDMDTNDDRSDSDKGQFTKSLPVIDNINGSPSCLPCSSPSKPEASKLPISSKDSKRSREPDLLCHSKSEKTRKLDDIIVSQQGLTLDAHVERNKFMYGIMLSDAGAQFEKESKVHSPDRFLSDAKRLKHEGDAEATPAAQVKKYLESALYFMLAGNIMLNRAEGSKQVSQIYQDTQLLLRHATQLRLLKSLHGNMNSICDDSLQVQLLQEKRLAILSLQVQAVLIFRVYQINTKEDVRERSTAAVHDFLVFNPRAQGETGAAALPNGATACGSSASPAGSHSSISSVGAGVSTGSVGARDTGSTNSGTASGPTCTISVTLIDSVQKALTNLNHLQRAHDLWSQASSLAISSCNQGFFAAAASAVCAGGFVELTTASCDFVKFVREALHRINKFSGSVHSASS